MPAILAVIGSYLVSPLKWIGQWFISIVISKVGDFVKNYIEEKKRTKELEDVVAQYKSAKTPEEQERAFKEIIRIRGGRK